MIGYGASHEGVARVKSGKWFATLGLYPAGEMAVALQYVVDAINGKKAPNPIDVMKTPGHPLIVDKAYLKAHPTFKGDWGLVRVDEPETRLDTDEPDERRADTAHPARRHQQAVLGHEGARRRQPRDRRRNGPFARRRQRGGQVDARQDHRRPDPAGRRASRGRRAARQVRHAERRPQGRDRPDRPGAGARPAPDRDGERLPRRGAPAPRVRRAAPDEAAVRAARRALGLQAEARRAGRFAPDRRPAEGRDPARRRL